MASSVVVVGLDELGKQAKALGPQASSAINSALLAGAKVITAEAQLRVPRAKKHRGGNGRSPKHLADVLKAEVITKRNKSGVTVQGGANGPSFYWKFIEHGTVKLKARKYIAKSAEAKESEVSSTVADVLKDKLGL